MTEQHPVEDLFNLTEIAEELEIPVPYLYKYSDGRNNGFPEPKEVIGKYKLYSRDEVVRWHALWQRATGRMGTRK